MLRKALAKDIQRVLREHSFEVENKLNVSPVQLSIPVDGKGARIKVSVPHGKSKKVPCELEFTLNGEQIQIALDVCEDFQDYELL